MFASRHNGVIVASLVFSVFLWGGNNTGVRFLVQSWPPLWVGSTRFLCAGLIMFAVLRWTKWMGPAGTISPKTNSQLWWRGGLSLAIYIAVFNWALRFTAASHVALYLGASPVWALLWEGRSDHDRWQLIKRYAAAALALLGVVVLFWPSLRSASGSLAGELLGLTASVLWTNYGRQCRVLGVSLSGAVVTAHTMWRAGLLLLPFTLLELGTRGVVWNGNLILVQLYCILAGGVMAFALWNNALRHWKTSEVFLFNNLIPLSTMLWAHLCLDEAVTPTFWLAMGLVVSGVVLGQTNWPQSSAGRALRK